MAQKPSLRNAIKKLNKTILVDKKDVGSVYFYAIIAGLIALTLPLGIQSIIGFVMAASLSTSIIVLITVVILGVIVNGIVQVRQMQVIERIRQKIFARYSFEISDKLPNIDLQKMDQFYLPEVVNRYFDITNLIKGIEKILLDVPTAITQIALGLLLLSFYHPIFIAFGAILLILLAIILKATSSEGFETSIQASNYKYAIADWLQEVARTINTFKFSKENQLHNIKTDELLSRYLNQRTNHFKILATQFKSLVGFKILIISAMLIVGTWLLLNQQINIGQFIAADIVIILIINSIEKLIVSMDHVYTSLTSIEKLGKIVDSDVEENGSVQFNTTQPIDIHLKDVSYTYPDGSEALKNITLHFNANQINIIKGSSGAGKSTLIKILTGALSNYSGSISFNDVPLHNYNIQSIRKVTGIMLNKQDIFRGSIIDNLTMGNKLITMEEILPIAKIIGFNEFINGTKDGYNTKIEPTGKRINQHNKQNLLLLRALLGNPSILLLEDPLSHLKPAQQQALLQYIHSKKITCIIISNNDIPVNNITYHELTDGTILK
ncbi:ATP-binding cassette domain-containing protein [Ferruginibacter yonginensis]|uniref:ATP-binding cassette domain-containing protein n=1 Tax=Ferruginibacter yonginensis TaxID=1310416 RepID=A0ABV8QUB8_9BACT